MEGFVIADLLALPPGFSACPMSGDPFAAALAGAEDREPGSVLWGESGGRCRAAVVLAPDRDISQRTLTAMGLLALYDALAVLAPPQVPIEVADGDGLAVDGGLAAWVRAAVADGVPPDWAVIGIEVVLTAAADDPGETPGETCLAEEGFGAVTAEVLLGGFCRHLLAWIETWREDGAAGLTRALVERSAGQLVRT